MRWIGFAVCSIVLVGVILLAFERVLGATLIASCGC